MSDHKLPFSAPANHEVIHAARPHHDALPPPPVMLPSRRRRNHTTPIPDSDPVAMHRQYHARKTILAVPCSRSTEKPAVGFRTTRKSGEILREEGPDAITDKTRPSTIPATYHRPPATGTNVADGISGIAENHARHGHRSRETLPFR
ncbi:MAG: hypothetical protein PHQ27_10250, partial [Victivallales bacterium]|nr:hypothetical protein [Victivallales bacterium]